MKMAPIAIAVALVVVLPLPVAAQQLSEQDARRIVESGIDALNKAFRDKDAAAAAEVYSVDAIRVLPSGTVQGRAAITQVYAKGFGIKDWELEPDTIDKVRVISNDVILATGSWSGTFKGTSHLHGYWGSTVVRTGDTWKIVMGVVNRVAD